jgi:hypothetical protein
MSTNPHGQVVRDVVVVTGDCEAGGAQAGADRAREAHGDNAHETGP